MVATYNDDRRAFTLTLANEKLMAAVDYMGTVSGYQVPDKFTKAGLKAEKSKFTLGKKVGDAWGEGKIFLK